VSEITNLQSMAVAIKHLGAVGLLDIPEVDIMCVTSGRVTLTVYPYQITASQHQCLKRHFGPLKVEGTGDYKKLVGERKAFDVTTGNQATVRYEVSSAFKCRRIPKEELTKYDFQKVYDMAVAGHIELPECLPADFKKEPFVVHADDNDDLEIEDF
jgi:hypothetical protein